MRDAERYRELASQCVRLAQETNDSGAKSLLLEMAEAWRRLADRLSKSPDGAGSDSQL